MSAFNKIFIVSKTTRLEKLIKKGLYSSPQIDQFYKSDWEEANKIHNDVVDCFLKWIDKLGMSCTLKKENEISD